MMVVAMVMVMVMVMMVVAMVMVQEPFLEAKHHQVTQTQP